MTAAPYDIIQFFDSEELELHEVAGGDGEWASVEGDDRHELMDSTVLVGLWTYGVRRIAVEHDGRIVEFDLKEIIVRSGDPLTTVERTGADV